MLVFLAIILLEVICERHQQARTLRKGIQVSRCHGGDSRLVRRGARAAEWDSLEDIRKTYRDTDMVGALAIFNIKGNHYRLIVRMAFPYRRISELLTYPPNP